MECPPELVWHPGRLGGEARCFAEKVRLTKGLTVLRLTLFNSDIKEHSTHANISSSVEPERQEFSLEYITRI